MDLLKKLALGNKGPSGMAREKTGGQQLERAEITPPLPLADNLVWIQIKGLVLHAGTNT